MRIADERQSSEGLEGSSGADLGADGVRDGDDIIGGRSRVLGIRILAHVSYTGADGEVGGRVGAEGGDGAGALSAEDVGEFRRVVDAGAEVAGLCQGCVLPKWLLFTGDDMYKDSAHVSM